ncbi:MAG: hypothetical protein P8H66_07725 [Luminiphilus sp.]|nr:hypothetical protein [Luminiphilus sp.]MDG2137967.1 hypothetical protein [Luminiphilus sp.]MDG2493970.1 hypothetical protein [Luminiphilus sp.]
MMVLSGERIAWQCEAVFRRQRLLRAGFSGANNKNSSRKKT